MSFLDASKKWYISLTNLFPVLPKCVYYDKQILLWSSGERNTIKINARETYIAFSFVRPCLKFWPWPHLRGWQATLLTVSPLCHHPCWLWPSGEAMGQAQPTVPRSRVWMVLPRLQRVGAAEGACAILIHQWPRATWQEIWGLCSQIFQRFTAIISPRSY